MAEMKSIELFVLIDDEGDYAVADELDAVGEKFSEDYTVDGPVRLIKVILDVELPSVVELKAKVTVEKMSASLTTIKQELL